MKKKAKEQFQTALKFSRDDAVQRALQTLSTKGSVEERGAVFTKSEIVEGILDLCGYSTDRDLASIQFLEPSCGQGEFLSAAIQRLCASARRQNIPLSNWSTAFIHSITAVELHSESFQRVTDRVRSLLVKEGLVPRDADLLCAAWIKHDDFLLTELPRKFDIIVGNPPYVHQERIPPALLLEYRRRFSTLYDRADMYVLFYERCFGLLAPDGVLGFICANRWIKNKYGAPLRELISKSFTLEKYIDLQQAAAFHSTVDSYPAVTIIRRSSSGKTVVVREDHPEGHSLRRLFFAAENPDQSDEAILLENATPGKDPWLLDAPRALKCIRLLEKNSHSRGLRCSRRYWCRDRKRSNLHWKI